MWGDDNDWVDAGKDIIEWTIIGTRKLTFHIVTCCSRLGCGMWENCIFAGNMNTLIYRMVCSHLIKSSLYLILFGRGYFCDKLCHFVSTNNLKLNVYV